MMNLKLSLLFVTIIFASIIPVCICSEDTAPEVIPPNPKGFIGPWHPAPECGQCHVTLLSEGELLKKLGSCKCHKSAYTTGDNIDMGKIRDVAHGSKPCIDCHIGSGIVTSVEEISSDEIHRAHLGIDCQADECHGKTVEPSTPKTTNCNLCHLGDAHFVHGDKLGSLCVACHGSFGEQYKEDGYAVEDGVPVTKQVGGENYPTILNILKVLIEFISKK